MQSNLGPVNRLFTDRECVRARVRRLVHERGSEDGTTLVKLHGAPGVGTTELARQLAVEFADHYPDARMEIDLGGPDPGHALTGDALLDRLLLLCGAHTGEIPGLPAAKRDLFLRLTDGKAFALVLDNAVGAGQVRALLPGRSRCLLLVTSPEALPRVGNVEEEMSMHVEDMQDEAVTEILRNGLSEEDLEEAPEGALERLVELCHGLPLLAHIAIAYMEDHPYSDIEDLNEHLEEGGGDSPRDRIAAHVSSLSERAEQVFRAIGTHTALGPNIDRRALAAALGDRRQVRDGLNELGRLSLVQQVGPKRAQWISVGSLVGELADEWARTDGRTHRERLGALCAHYRDAAVRAASLLTRRPLLGTPAGTGQGPDGAGPDGEREATEARHWLNTGAEVLAAVVRESEAVGDHATVIATAEAASVPLAGRGRASEHLALLEQGNRAAAASGDVRAQIRFGNLLGMAHLERGETEAAEEACTRSFELAEPGGDTFALAGSLEVLGLAAQRRGEHPRAVQRLLRVRELKESLGRPQALAVTDLLIARSQIELGRCAQARERLTAALPVFAEPGEHRVPDAVNVAKTRLELGRALLGLGKPQEAEVELRAALERFAERDLPGQRARALEALAVAATDPGARDRHLAAAADLYRDLGDNGAAERVEAERGGAGNGGSDGGGADRGEPGG